MQAAAVGLPCAQVLVLDDHMLFRLGVRTFIAGTFGHRFEVVEAATLEAALAHLQRAHAQVAALLLDLKLPDARGFGALHVVRLSHPGLPIVVMSGARDRSVRDESLRQGAAAFFCKAEGPTGLGALIDVLHTVDRPDRGAKRAMCSAQALRENHGLSPRQLQILELLLAGMDNRAISMETGLGLGTVKNYVSSVFLNLNVCSRAGLHALFAD